jgi:glycosyltransferase involved in cell wall biosynthesis
MKIRLLSLSTYPVKTPRHGGQIRVSRILVTYKKAGFDAQHISVYDAEQSISVSRNDIPYPPMSPYRLFKGRAVPFIADLTAGIYASKDERAYRKITRRIHWPLDVIEIEQPWLLPLALRLRDEPKGKDARLVYSSQNIEASLKKAILQNYGIPEAEEISDLIWQLETDACRRADIAFAVTKEDCRILSDASDKPIFLAANGIDSWKAETIVLNKWRNKLPEKFTLFIGSAHPPNIRGFFECLGDSLAFIPPDMSIVVVGSVGLHLLRNSQSDRWSTINRSRMLTLGLLGDSDFSAVKDLAHVFILPITQAGGSNIKTAEALYSGKHVVGTTVSFRGYEEFLGLSGIYLADNPQEFRRRVQDLLNTPLPHRNKADHALMERLLWCNTLKEMPDRVRSLLAQEVGAGYG